MNAFAQLRNRKRERRVGSLLAILLSVSTTYAQTDGFEPLFDGETFAGWEGNEQLFKVEDGAIAVGRLEASTQSTEFLCTIEEFDDFELRLEAKLTGSNAGVHFRAARIPGSSEVGGYQADMGFISGQFLTRISDAKDVDPDSPYPLWGSLLDEFRPDRSRYPDPNAPYRLIAVADREIVENVLRSDGWNQMRMRAVGPRIDLWLNDVHTVEFVEQESVPRSGLICLQSHRRSPPGAFYKNIEILRISR